MSQQPFPPHQSLPGHSGASPYAAGPAAGGYPGQGQAQGMGALPHPHAYPAYLQQQWPNRSLLSMPNDRFLKGLLIGAAVTYLVTNEQVQRTAIKGVVKTWSLLQGGIEEVKERFGDAAAELQHSKHSQEG